MLRDFVFYIINLLVVTPFEADINARLANAGAPQVVMSQVQSCASAALPVLVTRVSNDPWWGITTVTGIWLGTTSSETVIVGTAPTCRPVIEAARSYLGANSV